MEKEEARAIFDSMVAANKDSLLNTFSKQQFGVDPFHLYMLMQVGIKGRDCPLKANRQMFNIVPRVLIENHGQDFLAWLAKTEAAYREAFQHKCKALESLGLFSDLAKKQKSPELQEKVNARLRYILLSRNGINPEDFFPLPEIKSTVELSEMYKVTKQRILDITDEAERGLLRKKIQPGIARDTLPILTRKYSLRSCVVYYAGMMALSDDNPRIAAIFAVLSGPSYPQIQTNFPVSDIFEFKTEPVTPPDVAVVQDALRQGEVLLYNPDNNIAIELPEESKVSPSLSSEEAAIAQEIAGTIIKALEVSGYVLSTLAEVSTQQRNSPITVRFEDIQGLIGDALKDR